MADENDKSDAAIEGAAEGKGAPDPEASAAAARKGEQEPGTATEGHVDDAIAGRSVPDGRWKILWIVGLLSLVADQLTKIYARHVLPTSPKNCDIPHDYIVGKCTGVNVKFLGDVWDWRLSMNPGSAFGLFGSNQELARVFLSVVGVAAVGGMIWMLKKSRHDQRILHWALALVAGGAVGNLIDRIGFGVVTDMISWHYEKFSWPVFNVADVVLVVGVGLMFIDIQKEGKREKALKAGKRAAREARRKEALKAKGMS
ncbi:MAG TPA: signal peptidase II [Kofleriaceae bacterium]|jgi:signal peptidase II